MCDRSFVKNFVTVKRLVRTKVFLPAIITDALNEIQLTSISRNAGPSQIFHPDDVIELFVEIPQNYRSEAIRALKTVNNVAHLEYVLSKYGIEYGRIWSDVDLREIFTWPELSDFDTNDDSSWPIDILLLPLSAHQAEKRPETPSLDAIHSGVDTPNLWQVDQYIRKCNALFFPS